MKNVRAHLRFWLAGVVTALAGVTVTRLIAPSFPVPLGPIAAAAGQLLALVGLFIICLGVRRRIQQVAE